VFSPDKRTATNTRKSEIFILESSTKTKQTSIQISSMLTTTEPMRRKGVYSNIQGQ